MMKNGNIVRPLVVKASVAGHHNIQRIGVFINIILDTEYGIVGFDVLLDTL